MSARRSSRLYMKKIITMMKAVLKSDSAALIMILFIKQCSIKETRLTTQSNSNTTLKKKWLKASSSKMECQCTELVTMKILSWRTTISGVTATDPHHRSHLKTTLMRSAHLRSRLSHHVTWTLNMWHRLLGDRRPTLSSSLCHIKLVKRSCQ